MYFYKIKVAYDGTAYQGWQEQKNSPTVVGQLKKSFKRVFKKSISIVGASRTDSGVHAMGQVARVRTDLDIQPLKLMQAWNGQLPFDVSIISIEKVGPEFHPMKNVIQKVYCYNFFTQRPLPFNTRFGWYWHRKIDIDKLQECLKIFIGKHDFRSFATGNEKESTVKSIDSIQLIQIAPNVYQIEVKGKAFLHHMIRRIVGACLEVSSRPKLEPEYLKQILEEKNPNQALPNADAKGLTLYEIKYLN